MIRFRFVVLGAMSLLVVPALVRAQGKSVSHSRALPPKSTAPLPRNATIQGVFQDPDRTVFRDYFARHHLVVTNLPPGIAKNVERGKPLPPGIAMHAFPRSLVKRRSLDRDVAFVMVGNNMFAMRNGIVVDMMWNVFP
jgi:hypothetical protein